MSNLTSLTAAQLRHAATIKETIARLERELSHLLNVQPKTAPAPKKRGMSAAGRARIAAAAKARWAKAKAAGKKRLG